MTRTLTGNARDEPIPSVKCPEALQETQWANQHWEEDLDCIKEKEDDCSCDIDAGYSGSCFYLSHRDGRRLKSQVTESSSSQRAGRREQEVSGCVRSASLCVAHQHSPSGTCRTTNTPDGRLNTSPILLKRSTHAKTGRDGTLGRAGDFAVDPPDFPPSLQAPFLRPWLPL